MISLLLTLFISLFSVCPAFNKVDQAENNIFISDNKPINNRVLIENQYVAYSVDEFANEPFYNQLFTLYSSYTESFTNSWSIAQYCNLSITENKHIDTLLTPSENFLVSHIVDGVDDQIFTLCYKTEIPNNTREYYGFVVDKVLAAPNQYIYHAWGVHFYGPTNPYSIAQYSYFYNLNSIMLGMCVYLPALYLSSDDLVLYNGLYTGFVNEDGLYNDITSAYTEGYNKGYDTGYTEGNNNGYQDGYQEGLVHADYDSTALTIMQGIIDVGLLPVNVFLLILNFEVFGVNISGFVSALLTISIVIIIVRFLFGGKSDGK